mmetsp:Transcript_73596/g.157813  ORF Transcript_73596/g.157813 Transcript_73596/m.157813 type:complete len:780 (-) Transcript_73596:132-2471(-)
MNSKTVSLPDLVQEKRRNTCLSLSEGFTGADYGGALAATVQNFALRPGAGIPFPGKETGANGLTRVLPIYYRTRQLVLATEKAGHRVPMKLASEMKGLENALAREIRAVHPLLFQRFDDAQLSRLLRAMPFLRLSHGRWIFGSEELDAAWPPTKGDRAFMLLSGKVALFPDPSGAGERTEIFKGAIFGEKRFRLGDESMQDMVAGAAHCEEPCIIGIMSTPVIEATYADRAFGNKRISQLVRQVPSLSRITQPDEDEQKEKDKQRQESGKKQSNTETQDSNAVICALQDLGKVSTTLHIGVGKEVLSEEPLGEESLLIVCKGGLEVRGDITLVEKLDALEPKRVRLRVYIDRAEKLAGDSIWDKLDPYVLVKLGDFKRFQTPVIWNAGPNPKFEYNGVLAFGNEEILEFVVMDNDKYSADDLCGSASIAVKDLYDGYKGKIELTRPKQGIFAGDTALEEPAGKLFFSIKWDYEKINALTRVPQERKWTNQNLFELKENDCWGHEQLILGGMFKRTLEQASNKMKYQLTLDNFRVLGLQQKSGNPIVTCWKASRRRFTDFIKHCGREKQFTQACRVSSLEKQTIIHDIIARLVKKWEEAQAMPNAGPEVIKNREEGMDPSKFRVAYRGVKCHITARSATNLSGGGWFDKLDPYAVIRFRGAKAEFRTSVLQDAGADPVWECEGNLLYSGETALEVAVFDYDKYSADDLVATCVLQVEQFCSGFEGMIPLTTPGTKKKKSLKQSFITLGIQWDPPRDPGLTMNTTAGTSLTGLRGLGSLTH